MRFYTYSELSTCSNMQTWFNNEITTTERCKDKFAIYINNKPRTFSNVRVLLNNVVTTIEFFDNSFYNLPTRSKCGLKVRQIITTEYFDDRYVIDFIN